MGLLPISAGKPIAVQSKYVINSNDCYCFQMSYVLVRNSYLEEKLVESCTKTNTLFA